VNFLIKALGFRILAILFTALFVPIETSLVLNIGLFVIYYVYDLIWLRYVKISEEPRRGSIRERKTIPLRDYGRRTPCVDRNLHRRRKNISHEHWM
jgi:hypothetical protein